MAENKNMTLFHVNAPVATILVLNMGIKIVSYNPNATKLLPGIVAGQPLLLHVLLTFLRMKCHYLGVVPCRKALGWRQEHRISRSLSQVNCLSSCYLQGKYRKDPSLCIL